jgi:hypothetical protein
MTRNDLITVRYGRVVIENVPGSLEPYVSYLLVLDGMAGDTSHVLAVVASITASDR